MVGAGWGIGRAAAVLAVLAVLATCTAGRAAAQDGGEPAGAVADRRILISLADRRLYLLPREGEAQSYPVAIGRPDVLIPTGDTSIVRKRRDPTWRPTASQRRARPSLPRAVPPGPSNPLGRFALDLGWPAYAIHGTNEPDSIGRRVSSGCFRMRAEDIEALFAAVDVGTPVRVIGEPAGAHPSRPALPPAAVAVSAPAAPPAAPRPLAKPPPVAAPVALAAAPQPPSPHLPSPHPASPYPAAPYPTRDPSPPRPAPDPRCATATAPLKRLVCDVPELAALDGRARALEARFIDTLPAPLRGDAAYAFADDERRFQDLATTTCWIRRGGERDPSVAAAAAACLLDVLRRRMTRVEERIGELGRTLRAP